MPYSVCLNYGRGDGAGGPSSGGDGGVGGRGHGRGGGGGGVEAGQNPLRLGQLKSNFSITVNSSTCTTDSLLQ